MSAGIQPNLGIINQSAGVMATALRDLFAGIINFNDWLNSFGGAAELESQLQMSTADAQVLVATFGNLANLAAIYQGTQNLPVSFNYMANSELLWGGQ